MAEKYFKGEIDDIEEISSLRQVRELFLQFRMLYKKLEKKVQETGISPKKPEVEGKEAKASEDQKEKTGLEEKGVGEKEETAAGFGLGTALKGAKPKLAVDVGGKSKNLAEEEAKQEEGEEVKEEPVEVMPGTEIKSKKEKKVEVLDRQTVYYIN